MRSRQEIIDYLGLWMSEDYVGKEGIEINERLIKAAEKVEVDFAEELAAGTHGYGLYSDFVNTPTYIEDIGYHELQEVSNYGGVVLYKRTPRLRYYFDLASQYIFEIPLNEHFHLFIEGLDENGCTNAHKEFDINNIKAFCVEIIDDNGEYVKTIDVLGVTLDTTIERLRGRVHLW